MPATPPPAHDELADCVRHHTGAAEVALERIGTGKFNTGYFVRADGRELVLRVAPPRDAVFLFYERRMMRQEPALHRLLRERTEVPVAEVVAFDESHDRIDRDFILMERLPGIALSDAPPVDARPVMRAVGVALAEVHALTADAYGYVGEHRPMEPQESWAEAFRVMWNKLLDDVAGVGYYDAAERRALADLHDRHAALFDRPVPAALLHMDVWAQNILVDERGRFSGLVDWDRALWGDPEIEFAVLDYCGISTPDFWAGYGAPRDEGPAARTRNVFYLLYEMQKYIVIRHGRSGDPAAARRHKRHVTALLRQHFG
jgi:aminoglycoside phosphotransferase (APT) family kinase protein